MHPDGGGIRGLSELLILQEIMNRIKAQENLEDVPLPCDYFDLIGGTSTGGYAIIPLIAPSRPRLLTRRYF